MFKAKTENKEDLFAELKNMDKALKEKQTKAETDQVE